MSELSAAFEGLEEAFDTEFEEDGLFTNDTSIVVRDKSELVPVVTDDDKTIRDTDFVSNEIKCLIESSKGVLNRLDSDIKIGSKASMYEVYSQLTNSITAQLKELRQLHESVAKVKMDKGKKSLVDGEISDKIELTSEQLLDMINKAAERSEMKEIKAEFKVDDEMLPTKEINIDDGE